MLLFTTSVYGDSTNDDNDQTNSSGSNTQITGGYTATTTNNNDGQLTLHPIQLCHKMYAQWVLVEV